MPEPSPRPSFSAKLVLPAVLGLLALAGVPSLGRGLAANRDATRIADVERLQRALAAFHREHGRYPRPEASAAHGGWDVSHDGDFVPELRAAGLLDGRVADPLDDERHHYRYYVYEPGAFGCGGGAPFYVLGVRRFETAGAARAHTGHCRCAGRDWGAEFDYVVASPGASRQ